MKFRGDRKTGEEFSMSIENVDKGYASKNGTKGRQLLSLFAGLALALTIGASNAKAQIVGDLLVTVPFQFHAGNSDFPAAEYRLRSVHKSELIFNKYGDQYFLSKLYDQGERIGSEVLKTLTELRISQNVAQAEEHVPTQRGK